MSILKNERGVTLLVVLVLSAVALVIVAGLIYMATEGTKMSGSTKRYKTALEAARAGTDVAVEMINSRPTITTLYAPPYDGYVVVDTTRLTKKLYTASTSTYWAGLDRSISIDPAVNSTYDVSFRIGVNPAYTIFLKITGTVQGNSGAGSSRLHKSGTTTGKTGGDQGTTSGSIAAPSSPFLYSIEVLSLNAANPMERAKLSVLYQY